MNEILIKKIRAKFPRVDSDAMGRKRIFFDAGAGTQVLESSVKAMADVSLNYAANIGPNYPESAKCDEIIIEGRGAIADFLNAEAPETIVSAESATNLLGRLGYTIGKYTTKKNNVVSTYMEHLGNASPWFEMERRGYVKEAKWVGLNDDTTLNMDDLKSKVDKNTKVVSCAYTANLFGTKNPLKEIGKIAHDVGAYFVVDAVHHAPHGPIDVKELDCDFLIFSMYKVFTPKYICFMYGKMEHIENLFPYSVERNVTVLPDKWELGSIDPAKFAATIATMDYFVWLSEQIKDQYKGKYDNYTGRARSLKIALAAIKEYEKSLSTAMLKGFDDVPGLPDIPGVDFYGIKDLNRLDERDPTFAFKIADRDEKEVENLLVKKYGIDLRYVFDSWNMAHNFWNIPTMGRASLVHYNTVDEVHRFLKAVEEVAKK
ncbi:MAG: aminotransferase class V-fold PLP-dependent enzyme [Spirochaetota bacterium]|nr:MAG: aminotransferase class V-fold PLP-dependent enzyme [Spirochaetota bacterium]